jgi:chromosome segregation ATPase
METLSQQLADAQQSADKSVAAVKTKLQKAELAAQALNRQLKFLQKQKEQTEMDVKRAQFNSTRLAKNLKSFESDSATQLKKQEARMKKMLVQRVQELEDAQDELQKSQAEAKAATDMKKDLLEKVKKLTDKLAVAEVKKSQRQQFEVNIGKQLTTARSTQYDLKAEVSREKKELAKERDENLALENKEAKMQRQMGMKIQDLEDDISAAEAKANKTVEEQKALRVDDDNKAHSKIADLHRQFTYLQTTTNEKYAELKKKVQNTEDALGKERRHSKALQDEEEKLKTNIAKQKRQLQQASEELEDERNQQQSLEKNKTQLSSKLGDVESEIQLIKERSSMSQRKLNAKVQELTQNRDKLSHQLQVLHKNATTSEAQIENLEKSNEKMKRSMIKGANKIAELQDEIRDAQEKANQTIATDRAKHADEKKEMEGRIALMKDQLHHLVNTAKAQEAETEKKIASLTNQEKRTNASLTKVEKTCTMSRG